MTGHRKTDLRRGIPSATSDSNAIESALTALVRILARQAAREWLAAQESGDRAPHDPTRTDWPAGAPGDE